MMAYERKPMLGDSHGLCGRDNCSGQIRTVGIEYIGKSTSMRDTDEYRVEFCCDGVCGFNGKDIAWVLL